MEFHFSGDCSYANFVYFVDEFACIHVDSAGYFYVDENQIIALPGD